MSKDKQYLEDSARLSMLIEKYTNIPQDRVYQFVMENTAENLLPYANKLCKTEAQRQKLAALFEFKNLYEVVKSADVSHVYQFNNPDTAKAYFKNYFADAEDKEYFATAFLDTQNRVIKTERMSAGTIAKAHVYPREIIKEALFINANAVMLAHNHPSGDLKPSKPDLDVTMQVMKGMELMDMALYDHIIVGRGQAVSLMELGLIHKDKITSEVSKGAVSIGEKARKYQQAAKLPSIKQQLAFAEEQRHCERKVNALQTKKPDRGDR